MGTNERASTYVVVAAIIALLGAGVGFALFRSGSAGTTTASYPKQDVPPKGQTVGRAMPGLSRQRADYVVPTPPPLSRADMLDVIQGRLAWEKLFPGEWNVNVFPAQVTTLKPQASGSGAELDGLGGLAIVDGIAYVATEHAVIAMDLKTGVVDTLAGAPTRAGCVTGADASAVRFRGPAGDVATDGHLLFVANGCGISKVSLSTGATSALEPWSGPMAWGPDGHLYAAALAHAQPAIMRIDPAGGAAARYVAFPAGSYVLGLAADSRYLWATVDEGPSSPAVIDRIGFSDASITRFAEPGVDLVGDGQIVSAGNYLYAPEVGNIGLIQFSKISGGYGLPVGGTKGDSDGSMSLGSFGDLGGVASDGRELWVTDAGNSQLREIAYVQMFPGALVGT